MGHKWLSDQISANHWTLNHAVSFIFFGLLFFRKPLQEPGPGQAFACSYFLIYRFKFSPQHTVDLLQKALWEFGSVCKNRINGTNCRVLYRRWGKHTHMATFQPSDSEVYCCRILVRAQKTRRNWRSVLIQIQLILHLCISLNLCKKYIFFSSLQLIVQHFLPRIKFQRVNKQTRR